MKQELKPVTTKIFYTKEVAIGFDAWRRENWQWAYDVYFIEINPKDAGDPQYSGLSELYDLYLESLT